MVRLANADPIMPNTRSVVSFGEAMAAMPKDNDVIRVTTANPKNSNASNSPAVLNMSTIPRNIKAQVTTAKIVLNTPFGNLDLDSFVDTSFLFIPEDLNLSRCSEDQSFGSYFNALKCVLGVLKVFGLINLGGFIFILAAASWQLVTFEIGKELTFSIFTILSSLPNSLFVFVTLCVALLKCQST